MTAGTTKRISMVGAKQLTKDVHPSVDISPDGKVASWAYSYGCAGAGQTTLMRWSKITNGSVPVDSECVVEPEYDLSLYETRAYNGGIAGLWSNARGAGEDIRAYGTYGYTFFRCSSECYFDIAAGGGGIAVIASDYVLLAGSDAVIYAASPTSPYSDTPSEGPPAMSGSTQVAYQAKGAATVRQIKIWDHATDTVTDVCVSSG